MANEIEKRNEGFLIYQDENGVARVNLHQNELTKKFVSSTRGQS